MRDLYKSLPVSYRWYRDLLGAEMTIDRTPGIHPGKGGSTRVEYANWDLLGGGLFQCETVASADEVASR